MTMNWIWPLSWYFRIRELEAEVVRLKYWSNEMEQRLRAQALSESIMQQTYMSSLAAIAATYEAYGNTSHRGTGE